jgi:hypothetical protein
MSKWRRLAWSAAVAASLALLGGGCGDAEETPTTPTEICNTVARTECHRLYACTTPADRAAFGLVVSEVECILGLAIQLGCASATADRICAGNQPYPITTAQQCIDEVNRTGCDTIKANRLNFTVYAPSCAQCVPNF